MLGTLIGLALTLLVAGVLWYCIQLLMAAVPIAEPFATGLRIVLILIALCIVVWLITTLLGIIGVHVPMFR